MKNSISLVAYHRLPSYLKALRYMKKEGTEYVSSNILADIVRENASVVKKDLSYAITSVGKPKVGYSVKQLIADIESFLGYNNSKEAIIVGVGKLGQALMSYSGFEKYGMKVIAGFDIDNEIIGKEINKKVVMSIDKLESAIKKLNIKIAVLCTPQEQAQKMADVLVKAGIKAIWNFIPVHLDVPEDVMVKNEDLAANLSILAVQLKNALEQEND